MKTQNETIYQALDLLYDASYVSTQLADDPGDGGELDIPAFIDGKESCWRTLGKAKIHNKKSLILTTEICGPLVDFFIDLMNDGSTIYAPIDNQLIKMTSVHDKKTCHARAGGQPFVAWHGNKMR